MEKCDCWEMASKREWGDGFNYTVPIQICNGTREREECFCNGDESRCNFYPEKRKENKSINTAEMVIKANKDGKTYKAYDMLYNNQLGFHDIKGKKWDADAFKYVNDIFNLEWKLKPDNEMTKSEAEKRFNIKIVGE